MNKNADSITPLQVLFIAISWLALLSYSEKKRKENSEINSIIIKFINRLRYEKQDWNNSPKTKRS